MAGFGAVVGLLVAGAGPIFQLARVWRNNEGSARHAPEFTMLEWYRPGASMDDLVQETTEFLRAVLPPGIPRPQTRPTHWRYETLRPLLMRAGELTPMEKAERRVLVLENPAIRGASQITKSLYAGLQLILPGEIAPSHRHVASALRFIIEGDGGGYTAVDGERTRMYTGDFVLTPSWTYHDHGNLGTSPVVWLDVLDVPIVNTFESSFAEHHPQQTQPVSISAAIRLWSSWRASTSISPTRRSSPRVRALPPSVARSARSRTCPRASARPPPIRAPSSSRARSWARP